jgi:GWxTD domain-containing protein
VLGLGLLVTAAIAVRGQESVAGESAEVESTLLRSWAGDGVTVVDGLVNVPLGMLAAGTTNAYRFEITVYDAEGNQLFRDSWVREVSDQAARYVETDAAYLLESFRFGLRPGVYEVDIRAYPTDAADLGVRQTIAVEAFAEQPPASDLILSTRVEPLDPSGGGSWSVSRGGFGISAAARTVVLADDPGLYYYIELYGADEESTVSVTAEIRDPSGNSLFETPADEVGVPPGGRSFTGRLPLAGLPAGEYEFVMAVGSDGGTDIARTAVFELRGSASVVPVASGNESELSLYFNSLSDAELEKTFGGVAVLVTEAERKTYEALPPDAKRRYLVEFFASRDATPQEPGNPFLDEYLERIAIITSRYGERVGTDQRAAWDTDMGFIFLTRGEPADRVVNYSPSDEGEPSALIGSGSFAGEPPYEIWHYQDTGFVYLFIEENRFANWRMIFTTDRYMTSMADWERRIGANCARDLTTYFGIVPRL